MVKKVTCKQNLEEGEGFLHEALLSGKTWTEEWLLPRNPAGSGPLELEEASLAGVEGMMGK